MAARGFINGEFKRICDRTGFAVLASKTTKQWNNLIVRKRSAEPRHPQEFVRGRSDKQIVPSPRPRPDPTLVGPLFTDITQDASAGAQSIKVDSNARFLPGDRLGIVLANGDVFRTILMTTTGGDQLDLTVPLPNAVAAGNRVTNESAVSE